MLQAAAQLIDYHGDAMLRPGRAWFAKATLGLKALGEYEAKYAVEPFRRIA